MRRPRLVLGCFVFALLGSATREAHASGYLSARFGSDHGTPAMANPFAVYFNPAAMGGVKGTELTLDLAVALRSVTYDRPDSALSPRPDAAGLINDPSYRAANTGQGKLLNVLPLPFLGGVSDLGTKNFRVGYGLYIPFGGLATWNQDRSFGSDVTSSAATVGKDGPQRWHNISGRILAIYNTLALAYRFEEPRLTIGASVSGILHEVQTVRARNEDGSDDVVGANGALREGRSYLTAKGFNLGAALGVYWQAPGDQLALGLSYTSQPGFGQTRMNGELTQQFGAIRPPSSAATYDLVQTYPDIIRLGGTFKLNEQWHWRTDFEYVRWSVFENQCVVAEGKPCNVDSRGAETGGTNDIILNIPRNWKDAIGARTGAAYFIEPETELFASGAVTTPAVPKSTIDASTIDALRLYGTLGVRHEFSKHFALAGSYNFIYFFPVDTQGASTQYQYALPSKSPSSDGVYKSWIQFVDVNATVAF
jgi:long-chain fatty acid transport protein